jgi:mRNA interferase MazF
MFGQGDIININLNPQLGHEQAGYRPALVVSNNTYNSITGLCIVCPITNTDKNFPLHVRLDKNTKTTGVVLCEHVKALDIIARKAVFKEKIPDNILNEVLDIIYGSIEKEENI